MRLVNQAHDRERIKHYAARGIREVFFHGGDERQSFMWLYELKNLIRCEARSVFNWPDEVDHFTVEIEPGNYIELLGRARLGETVLSESSMTIEGETRLRLSPNGVSINTQQVNGFEYQIDFDEFFLDSLSLVENSEPRLRNARDIVLGPVEKSLLDVVMQSPEIVHSFSAREFEYFVGAFLTNAGFSKVRLSRFVKDGGYDLWAVYCEGDTSHTLVVEVKHYTTRRVGIEIVDRLNGVRDRKQADLGIVFTSSAFSAEAIRHYASNSKRISLVDFERLVELLHAAKGDWSETASKLWTTPFRQIE